MSVGGSAGGIAYGKITVQDAIRDQLDISIELWFNDRPVVAIQALAYNALRRAHDLAVYENRGQPSAFISYVLKLPEKRKRRAMRHIYFAKHGDREMKDIKEIEERPDLVEHDIFEAATCYLGLYEALTFWMELFAAKYFFAHPKLFVAGQPLSPFVKLLVKQIEPHEIARLTRSEFRDKVSVFLREWLAGLLK